MSRLLNVVLLWMLAAALPLQGMAAAAVMGCNGHHPAAVGSSAPAHEVTAGHGAGHLHHAGTPTAAAQALASADTAAPADGAAAAPQAAGHGCSVCAGCCAGFALLNTPFTMPAPDPAPPVGEGSSAPAESAPADAPERPPRA
jgi:hypothetical protein